MAIYPPSLKHWDNDVLKAALELDEKFPRSQWTSTYAYHGEHSAVGAYAVDLLCNRAMGNKIAEFVWANRKRLGVWYVIWYGRIISETHPERGWVRYYNADNPNPSKSHKNHVHVSFYPGRRYSPPVGPITMYVNVDTIKGYKNSGKVDRTKPRGSKIVGMIKSRSDGKYLVTAGAVWYPLDDLTKTVPVSAPVVPIK